MFSYPILIEIYRRKS